MEIKAALGKNSITPALLSVAALCLFIGATGKSAQLPLYTWLPDAMAGPTPVSALIHAATMVTAGIFMITRLNFLFELTPRCKICNCYCWSYYGINRSCHWFSSK